MRKQLFFLIIMLGVLSLNGIQSRAEKPADKWPKRVLITNDDGIEDVNMIELARAFSKICETFVVAPQQDRSSSAHYISVFRKYSLKVKKCDLGKGIKAFAVDGFPGDCVLLALRGLMKNNPPDLVISGINGGPNLGFDWLASGTIGAVRIASYWGVPGIAVSGMRKENPDALNSVINWVTKLAKSNLIRSLNPGQYITVSIPRIQPGDIKGIRVAKRAGILLDFSFSSETDKVDTKKSTWFLNRPLPVKSIPEESDAALYKAGYLVIVPMHADEHNNALFRKIKKESNSLPPWPSQPSGR